MKLFLKKRSLYQFPRVAVPKYHKLSGGKKCTVTQFLRLKV